MTTITEHENVTTIDVVSGYLPRPWNGQRIQYTTGFIKLKDLIPRVAIALRSHFDSEGYQREASRSRVSKLADSVAAKRVDLPTALLLNLRDFNCDANLILRSDSETVDGLVPAVLRLTDEKLWCVDGQHRIRALQRLVEDPTGDWNDYIIPFVCILGGTPEFELEQFYVVNSNAKSVPTSLAFELLTARASSNPELIETLQGENKEWVTIATEMVNDLEDRQQLWKGRVRFPNEPRKGTTIQLSGMVNSLRPVLNTPFFKMMTPQNRVTVIDAFWEGVRRCIPDAFTQPQDYTIQKSLGVTVMHQLLPDIVEVVRAKSLSTTDAEAYKDVLYEPLTDLSEENPDGEPVSGAEFWATAPRGAAGTFSSSAGRRVLTSRFRRMLEPIEVS